MERIAPLARILAEANGIDWRSLPGSGEGGLIVEGDILNYLSRIMSGEEEPPATPVDAPPPDWTGADVLPGAGMLAPGMPSMDMLSSAGVDQDLAALVAPPQPAPAIPPTLEEEALEFELEDEQAATPAPARLPEPRPAAELPSFAAPALPVPEVEAPARMPELAHAALGRERVPETLGRVPAPVVAAPQPGPAPVATEVTLPTAPPAAGGLRGGLGSLLSRLYQQPTAQPAPTPALPESPAAAAPPMPAPVPEVEVPAPAVPVVEEPVAEVPAPCPEIQPELRDVSDVEPVTLAPEVPTVAAVAEPEQPEIQVAEQVEETETVLSRSEMPAPVTPAADPSLGAVWFGAYLRRDANLAPAAELRRSLSAALGQDVPLALLVARAAGRHTGSLGLSTVAVQDLDEGRTRTVQPGSLRDALAALETDHEGTPDLLVIDAGALDLDDLHLPHTVTLSVGRVRDGRAALTLNGDVDAARAVRFLADVAGTLEEPIILVI